MFRSLRGRLRRAAPIGRPSRIGRSDAQGANDHAGARAANRARSRQTTPPRWRNLPIVRSLDVTATLFPQPRRGLGPLCGFSMLKAAPPFPVEPGVDAGLPPPSEPVAVVERRATAAAQPEDARVDSGAASLTLEDAEI